MSGTDFEYAIKRFRDPVNRSAYEWLFENKIAGLDEYVERQKKAGRFDYDEPVAGIEVRGKYVISFKLKEPDFNFLYILAMPNVVPVAREVIEGYAADTHGHPVGTGPYVLREWVRRSKIVLERNPGHRGYELAMDDPDAAADALLEASPELDEELVRLSAEYLSTRFVDEGRAWGTQDLETWERFTTFLVDAGMIDEAIDNEAAFTNDFLPGE